MHFFFHFIYLLPTFIKERFYNTLSVLAEGSIKHILMAIVWLYGFESVFCLILKVFKLKSSFLIKKFYLIFCLLSICCSFCNRIKNLIPPTLYSFYRSIGNRTPMGYFCWFLMVFITLKLIVLKKISKFYHLIVFVLYCLIVTKIFYWVVAYLFWWIESFFLFNISSIWRYFDYVIKFCFLKPTWSLWCN